MWQAMCWLSSVSITSQDPTSDFKDPMGFKNDTIAPVVSFSVVQGR
jgi:hypothetical protein